jgi:thioesterase domain-containing protein
MDIVEILKALSPELARSLQIKLEDCAVSTHLTEDEAAEIIDGVVDQLRTEDPNGNYAQVLDQITEAVLDTIFG